ncbi:serine/threonine-protein kinase 36 isoform X5 [Mauremys mutica]|uniref:serine/threonine-protein kinase 36 isoform X5 n=1 Tax=Mauremys mutica TaxID=74926 RepID=UPI001D133372|nr:serine/threonine-protein kinase 36 isoform X5 [Mauremys mutica]
MREAGGEEARVTRINLGGRVGIWSWPRGRTKRLDEELEPVRRRMGSRAGVPTMEKYHVLEMIGEGSFGRVYKGRRKYSAQVVALKFIPKVGRSEKELKNLQREIEIMRGLHHPNIVQMLDSFETDKEVVVVTDYAEGELFQILEDDGNLPEEQVQDIASQLVSALYYLHSHRILHRDMKPQNILLGKGGVIKLCDFGFARAMSIHTMVLTSIKGTPLYMAPELVQERPYDHTADLWAVGCILYELVVGTPPFYTNSIFQLVSLIVKDPITWPKAMSPSFKSFLQGLLMKDPRQRLAWPELLCHPFIAGRVTMIDDTEPHGLANPFTSKLPPELQVLKEKQAHSLAPRSGQSRILRKARQRMAQEARRKEQLKADAPCKKEAARGGLGHKPNAAPGKAALRAGEQTARAPGSPPGDETQAGLGEEPSEAEWGTAEPPPTPREHRITQDYEREFPAVPAGPRGRRSIETVDLENEELDSDDEWQHLIEATEPATMQLSTPLSLLGDPAFLQRIRARLQLCSQQVLEGMLEGASHLRPALRVLANLLASGCDSELLYSFCQAADLPQGLLHLLGQMLQSASSRQQPWCITLLTDLVGVITAYFTSEPPLERSRRRRSLQVFHEAAAGFLSLLPKLLAQPRDVETRLREQSSTCFARLCERMDGSSPCVSGPFYAGLLAEQRPLLDALLQGATLAQPAPEEPAREQQERGADVFTAALAAVCSLPVGRNGCQEAKKQVAQQVAEKLAEERSPLLARLLAGLERPACSLNVLKVLYSCGHASKRLCRLLAKGQQVPSSLARLVKGEGGPGGERCRRALHPVGCRLPRECRRIPAGSARPARGGHRGGAPGGHVGHDECTHRACRAAPAPTPGRRPLRRIPASPAAAPGPGRRGDGAGLCRLGAVERRLAPIRHDAPPGRRRAGDGGRDAAARPAHSGARLDPRLPSRHRTLPQPGPLRLHPRASPDPSSARPPRQRHHGSLPQAAVPPGLPAALLPLLLGRGHRDLQVRHEGPERRRDPRPSPPGLLPPSALLRDRASHELPVPPRPVRRAGHRPVGGGGCCLGPRHRLPVGHLAFGQPCPHDGPPVPPDPRGPGLSRSPAFPPEDPGRLRLGLPAAEPPAVPPGAPDTRQGLQPGGEPAAAWPGLPLGAAEPGGPSGASAGAAVGPGRGRAQVGQLRGGQRRLPGRLPPARPGESCAQRGEAFERLPGQNPV